MSARPRSRIVVALDSLDARNVAVEIARHLRHEAVQELLGVFVEDTYILDHARSRLAREIMLSGTERPLLTHVLERQIRAQSAQIRLRFEAAASGHGISHSFRVVRGDLLSELSEQALEAEALVLSLPRTSARLNELLKTAMERFAEMHIPLLLLAREGWLSGRCVIVIVADPSEDNAALRTAGRIARASGSSLEIVLTGDALAAGGDWMSAVVRRLGVSGIDVGRIIAMATLDAPAIERLARNNEARLLILPSGPAIDRNLVAELSRGLTSALMLVES